MNKIKYESFKEKSTFELLQIIDSKEKLVLKQTLFYEFLNEVKSKEELLERLNYLKSLSNDVDIKSNTIIYEYKPYSN
jgi:oligoendopeptidase F